MPTPSEYKTIQARIPKYAEAIGWTFVPREEAGQRRGCTPVMNSFFTDFLYPWDEVDAKPFGFVF